MRRLLYLFKGRKKLAIFLILFTLLTIWMLVEQIFIAIDIQHQHDWCEHHGGVYAYKHCFNKDVVIK